MITIILILASFICGAIYGYAHSIKHCDECHDNDKPFGYKG